MIQNKESLESLMTEELWALVPASGVGSRMQSDRPKQYLSINKRFILDLTLQRLLSVPNLAGVMVVLSDEDQYWEQSIYASHPKIHTTIGGLERFNSVLNGLYALEELASEEAWVMVHDAARPCVRVKDIEELIAAVSEGDGGLLGVPAKDTVKLVDAEQSVKNTVDRSKIWLAYTPQMFRIGQLMSAIESAIQNKTLITDDASAMELAGFKPKMVKGASDNIKITHPDDLELAKWYLDKQS